MYKALITGSSSMLGKTISTILKKQNIKTITLGRRLDNDIIYDFKHINNIIENPKQFTCDVIYHCVASFEADTFEGIIANELVNHLSLIRLVELANSMGCKNIVSAGSIFSHDNFLNDSYGLSKKRGEEILKLGESKYNINYTSLRFSQLIDDFGECKKHQPWYARIIRYTQAGKLMRLPKCHEEGEALRNYLHVNDAANIMIDAYLHKIFGIYNVCAPESIAPSDLAHKAYKIFGKQEHIIFDESKQPFRHFIFPEDESVFTALQEKTEKTYNILTLDEIIKRVYKLNTAENFGDFDIA